MSFVSRLIDPNPPLTPAQVRQEVVAALQAGNLDAAGIQAAAAAAIAAAGAPSPIRSIQRGVLTMFQTSDDRTVTITSVDRTKSALTLLGVRARTAGGVVVTNSGILGVTLEFSSNTQIRILRAGGENAGANSAVCYVSYQVVEYV